MNKFANSLVLSTLIMASPIVFAEGFDNTNILVEQAVNHIYNQRYKQAHSTLKEAYEQSPRHPGVHFNLGRLFELTGNFEEALKEYRLAASLDQSMIAAKRGMARCSVELKKAGISTAPVQSNAPVVTQRKNNNQNQYVLPSTPVPTNRQQAYEVPMAAP